MPATVHPSAHGVEPWTGRKYRQASSAAALLNYTLTDSASRRPSAVDFIPSPSSRGAVQPCTEPKRLIQSSFEDLSRDDRVFATRNGFVHTVLEAYNFHHNLVLRPDDVWFAILTQLACYVNAHAAELQSVLVTHSQGSKKELHIETDLSKADHGKIAYHMTKLMASHLQEDGLRDWILPAFTTTTKVDQAVASVLLMGTLQKYFSYSWGTRCGIPSVTLLGEASDWVKLRERVERLSVFGDNTTAPKRSGGDPMNEVMRWQKLLRPVLDGFVATFTEPDSFKAKRFWQGVCDEHVPNGSGCTTYSGWITAFCFWDELGRCLHEMPSSRAFDRNPDESSVRLKRDEMPIGFTKVPVTLLDQGVAFQAEMIAGSMAMKATGTPNTTIPASETRNCSATATSINTIQPEAGWLMYGV